MSKFNAEQDEKLIDLVRDHPDVYAMKSRTYRAAQTRNMIWKEIAAGLNRSEADCKARWKSIRDYYLRRRKETRNAIELSKNQENFERKYCNLRFLDDTESETKSHILRPDEIRNADADEVDPLADDSQLSDVDDKYNWTHCKSDLTVNEVDLHPSNSSHDELETEVPPKRRKLKSEKDQLTQEINLSRDERETHLMDKETAENKAVSMFFKSMSATVQRFPVELQAEAKLRVLQIITELEVKAAYATSRGESSNYNVLPPNNLYHESFDQTLPTSSNMSMKGE